MLKKLLFLLFIISGTLNAQHIIWEVECEIPQPTCASHFPFIIDSEGNIVCVVDDGVAPYITPYFFKYSPEGELITFKAIENGHSISPLALSETDEGYKIFCGITKSPMLKNDRCVPIIFNTDSRGDTLSSCLPYNPTEYTDRYFDIEMRINNTIEINNNYYNAFVKDKAVVDSVSQLYAHTILNCYDNTGTLRWRKGYDTSYHTSHNSLVRDFKLTPDSTLLILVLDCENISTVWYYANTTILETDSKGNILKKFDFPGDSQLYHPANIVKTNNGDYILLGQYLNVDERKFFLWKINSEGEIIKTTDIEKKSQFDGLNYLELSSDGNINILGNMCININDPNNLFINDYRCYIGKIDTNLEIIWDFEWYDHTYDSTSGIREIKYLDDNTFIGCGFKDRFKHYVIKFSEEQEGVATQETNNNIFITTFPNPVTDICEIKLNNIQALNLEIAIYDIFGNKVKDISNEPALAPQKSFIVNLSGLAPGSYFVSVNAGGKIIRKKVLKI